MRYYYSKNGKLQEAKRRVVFLYKGRLRGSGSRYMRCDQLANFLNTHFGHRFEAQTAVLPKPQDKPGRWRKLLKELDGAAVIALKGSLDILTPQERQTLRDRAACLAIDHVDSFKGGGVFQTADLHIAASDAALQFMQRKCDRISQRDGFEAPQIALVDHHADMRVLPSPLPADQPFRVAYLGDPENTYIPEAIQPDMLAFSGAAQADFEQALHELPQACLHYGIRSESDLRQPKPFTKGFVAARADRNIIVSPSVPDAIRFLGEDYLFMTKDDSAQSIIDTVAKAKDLMGSPEAAEALDRMRAMRAALMPENIAQQLAEVLDTVF